MGKPAPVHASTLELIDGLRCFAEHAHAVGHRDRVDVLALGHHALHCDKKGYVKLLSSLDDAAALPAEWRCGHPRVIAECIAVLFQNYVGAKSMQRPQPSL